MDMKKWKSRILIPLMTLLLAVSMAFPALAIYDTMGNEWVISKKTPTGKAGRTMTISFTLHNAGGSKLNNVGIGLSEDVDLSLESDTEGERVDTSFKFPFEVTSTTFEIKRCGSLADGKGKTVSITAKVRKDLEEGYYYVPIKVYDDQGNGIADEYINIWIGKASTTETDEDEKADNYEFVLGEGAVTPHGAYPSVMNFVIPMRNNSHATVYDVAVEMVLDGDSTKFPFEINDGNYDRRFDKMGVDEVVQLPYSMAIRSDVYSGYYPITLKIRYSDSSTGANVTDVEDTFFVYVKNKEKTDELGDFNEHNRTRARIVIDSYATTPQKIIAGEEFELEVVVKNASQSVGAANMLFSVESEKVSDSVVFSSESGSNTVAVNSLSPGKTTTLKIRMMAKAGIDQRSYAVTLKAKYDSPEFKNAEESMSMDIPVYQIARLNTSTFEVMPDAISVGGETNVMFGINNTGKVLLYNVMATFEADSIERMESYVGNIKPGETGNVDCMLTGIAPTADDGNVKLTISYEDENGEVSTVEKSIKLMVMEPQEEEFDETDIPLQETEKTNMFSQNKPLMVGVCGGIFAVLVAGIAVIRHRKKKKLEEGMDDEIS